MIVTYKGNEEFGIPRHSKLRIESLPKRHLAFKHPDVHGAAMIELDPGKYVASVCNFDPSGVNACKYTEEFYVGIDEKSFKRLKAMRPRFSRGSLTSEGFRWSCTFPGCDEVSKSEIQQVIHEFDHFGIDLIAKLNAGDNASIRKAAEMGHTQSVAAEHAAKGVPSPSGTPIIETAADLDTVLAKTPAAQRRRAEKKPPKPHPRTNPSGE